MLSTALFDAGGLASVDTREARAPAADARCRSFSLLPMSNSRFTERLKLDARCCCCSDSSRGRLPRSRYPARFFLPKPLLRARASSDVEMRDVRAPAGTAGATLNRVDLDRVSRRAMSMLTIIDRRRPSLLPWRAVPAGATRGGEACMSHEA